jgi:acrylyl-CoA reductase (NADPH)
MVLAAPSQRPMESERWAGLSIAFGGDTLAAIIRAAGSRKRHVRVGRGTALNTTVLPFTLRSVNPLGINSVYVSRRSGWRSAQLARDLPLTLLDQMTEERRSKIYSSWASKFAGKIRGRTVIRIE